MQKAAQRRWKAQKKSFSLFFSLKIIFSELTFQNQKERPHCRDAHTSGNTTLI